MSTSQLTSDDIWQLFKETDRRMAEAERKREKEWQEIRTQMSENERKRDKEWEEAKAQFKETDRKIKQVNEEIGRLGSLLGDFVEEMVRPAAVHLFRERGLDVHEVHRNIEAHRDGEGIEVDLLVVDTTDVIAIECKSNLSVDDVNEHLQRLDKFKRLLPTYKDKRVLGAVSAMVLPEDVARYAYRKGLYVIAQTGSHMSIRNDEQFKARFW